MNAEAQEEPREIVKSTTRDRMKYFWIGAICLIIGAVGSGLTVYNANQDRDTATSALVQESEEKDDVTSAFVNLLANVDSICNSPDAEELRDYGICDTAEDVISDPEIIREVGPQGMQGLQGPRGFPGPRGLPGEVGPQGLRGLMGEIGTPGQNGIDGAPGRDGIDGAPGEPGAPGRDGIDGAPGPVGPAGPAGNDGAPGPEGPAGPTGATGAQGEQGVPGAPGTPGATVTSINIDCNSGTVSGTNSDGSTFSGTATCPVVNLPGNGRD